MIKIELTLSINDKVKVKLTDYGYEYYKKILIELNMTVLPKTNGEFYFTFRELMSIFGSCPDPLKLFEDDNIHIRLD